MLVHFFLFFITIDLFILLVALNKLGKNNMTTHKTFGLCFYLSYQIEFLLQFYFQTEFKDHSIHFISSLILILLFLQFSTGLEVFIRIFNSKIFYNYYKMRRFHQANGILVNCVGKILCYLLTRELFPTMSARALNFIFFLYFCFILLMYFVSVYYYESKGMRFIFNFRIMKEQSQKYWRIKSGVENDEAFDEEDLSVISLRSRSNTNQTVDPKISWVVFEDKIFDISDIVHPGGKFIFGKVRGTDITRKVEGKEDLIFFNVRTKKFVLISHQHDFRFDYILKKTCISSIQGTDFESNAEIKSTSSLQRNFLVAYEKLTKQTLKN